MRRTAILLKGGMLRIRLASRNTGRTPKFLAWDRADPNTRSIESEIEIDFSDENPQR